MRGMVLGFLMQETESGKQIYQRDLEARFHTNRSSITTMLQGMEQDGFITRSAVAKDARLKRLIATEKGRACHKQIEASIARFEDDLQSGIDPQQAAAAPRCAGADPAQRTAHPARGKYQPREGK